MRFTTVYATGMLSSETAVYVCLGLKKENASAADSHVRNYLLVCRIYSAAVVLSMLFHGLLWAYCCLNRPISFCVYKSSFLSLSISSRITFSTIPGS